MQIYQKHLFQEIQNTCKWAENKDQLSILYRTIVFLMSLNSLSWYFNSIHFLLIILIQIYKFQSIFFDKTCTYHRFLMELTMVQLVLLFTTINFLDEDSEIFKLIWTLPQKSIPQFKIIIITHDIQQLLFQLLFTQQRIGAMFVGISILARTSDRWDFSYDKELFPNESFLAQNIYGWCIFIIGIWMFIFLDVSLQISDEQKKQKDVQVMKVIHDLKNPIISIKNTIIDLKVNPELVILNTQNDCDDMYEMLENMRAEFKLKQGMQLKEDLKLFDPKEFAKSLSNSHIPLAENGKNFLHFEVMKGMPQVINFQRILLKRMVNNFITNSLKHTECGHVQVEFKAVHPRNLLKPRDQIHVGVEPDFQKSYLMIEVRDTGKGIPADKLKLVFEEKESDETGANQDGTGLGLPICAQLCAQVGSFIRYTSSTSGSTFRLYIENLAKTNKLIQENQKIEQDFNPDKTLDEEQGHTCNMLLIAEDSKAIMKRYVKWLNDNSLPYKAFGNGKDLQNQVISSEFLSCKKCSKLLVFTDLHMPFMDGKELVQKLKRVKCSKDIRVILISADEIDDDTFFKVIEKPASMIMIKEFYFDQQQLNNQAEKKVDIKQDETNSHNKSNCQELNPAQSKSILRNSIVESSEQIKNENDNLSTFNDNHNNNEDFSNTNEVNNNSKINEYQIKETEIINENQQEKDNENNLQTFEYNKSSNNHMSELDIDVSLLNNSEIKDI